MMKLIRYLLFPVVPFYFMVTWLRNKFYDWGVFTSTQYDIPIICVGNLSVGGTGKSPMIEYLIDLLKQDNRIATLSRGYKRSTNGFIVADQQATALTIGDEPYQFYTKFKDIIVAVDANRKHGISKLMQLVDPPQLILLDDAFQHRKVKANFYILLTPSDDLYINDMVLPTGNLREPRNGAKRADIIVVTKCKEQMPESEKKRLIQLLKPNNAQQVFFSWIDYSDTIKNALCEEALGFLSDKEFTLVSGIANSRPLVDFLQSKHLRFEHLNFNDHHEFTSKDIQTLKEKQWILTTEKDYMRLSPNFTGDKKLFYLPIKLKIDRPKQFEELIKSI